MKKFFIFTFTIGFLSFGDAKGEGWVYSQSVKALDEASPRSGHFTFMGYKLSENQALISQILQDYSEGLSSYKIAEKRNVCKSSVFNVLGRNNVKPRGRGHKTYSINENFFDEIDGEAKAYFLGFLYADGCNHKTGRCFSMNLQEKDSYILEEFKKHIGSNSPLGFIKKANERSQNQRVMKIGSIVLSKRLSELGVVSAKTHKITFPTFLSQSILHHFIRGYFDGDGCISIHKGNGYFSLCGTFDFCSNVKNILGKEIGTNGSIITLHKDREYQTFSFSIGGKFQVYKVGEYLYKDATIFLGRKRDKFLEHNKIIS